MVEIQYLLALEAVNDLKGTDYGTFRLLGALVDEPVLEHHHVVAGLVAQAPLLAYHTSLIVESLLLAGNVARPVVQYQQHRIDEGIAHQRHCGYIVHRLVPGSISVYVVAEAHSVFGQELEQALAGIVLGAVECHVLQEMGEPVLVVFFLQCSHVVGDIELRASRRVLIVIEIVGHSVVQASHPECRVRGDGLGKGRRC